MLYFHSQSGRSDALQKLIAHGRGDTLGGVLTHMKMMMMVNGGVARRCITIKCRFERNAVHGEFNA